VILVKGVITMKYVLVEPSGKYFKNPSFERWELTDQIEDATVFGSIEAAEEMSATIERAISLIGIIPILFRIQRLGQSRSKKSINTRIFARAVQFVFSFNCAGRPKLCAALLATKIKGGSSL